MSGVICVGYMCMFVAELNSCMHY